MSDNASSFLFELTELDLPYGHFGINVGVRCEICCAGITNSLRDNFSFIFISFSYCAFDFLNKLLKLRLFDKCSGLFILNKNNRNAKI